MVHSMRWVAARSSGGVSDVSKLMPMFMNSLSESNPHGGDTTISDTRTDESSLAS